MSDSEKSHSLINQGGILSTVEMDQFIEDKNDNEKTMTITIENKKDYRIDYKVFQWIFVIFFTLIAVIDRFTINLWPLWVDSPGPTIPGNFSVSCFTLIAWISSRMMLVSSSYIFLFQCRIFWNWFVEQSIFNKYIKIGDIHQSNNNLHFHIGWSLIGIPVVLHVWLIIFAALFPMNNIYIYDSWMRPNNPETGNSIPFFADNLLSLGINDVYRIISTSLTFFILIPYSIIKWTKNHNWTLAQYLHLFGGLIYTVDLIRMKSHPHCWFFNCPFILWWIIDRIYGIFWYRRCIANIVRKIKLDEQYIILYLRIPNKLHLLHTIGDIFYFNSIECGFDRAHPFTVFQNHSNKLKMCSDQQIMMKNWNGHKFIVRHQDDININDDSKSPELSQYEISRQDTIMSADSDYNNNLIQPVDSEKDNDENIESDWNIGVIMAVFNDHKDCYRRKTFTSHVNNLNLRYIPILRCWGPYRSEYRLLMKNNDNDQYPLTPLVLIGTGAGCSFMIDFYQYIESNNYKLDEKVYFYFSTRSISMFQWFTDITCHKHIDNLYVNAHLTSNDNVVYNKKYENKSRDSKIGRLSFEEILNNVSSNTNVYFCGSPVIQEMVDKLCKKLSLEFHAGHSFY